LSKIEIRAGQSYIKIGRLPSGDDIHLS
jgi:hypothetical protein